MMKFNRKIEMLNFLRSRTKESEVHPEITDKKLENEKHKQFDNVIKILLLGTAESGKTTIIKQMKILHINGFTTRERVEKIPEIYANIHESIFELVKQMNNLGLEYNTEKAVKSAEYILSIGSDTPNVMTEEYVDHIITLWNDSGIRCCFQRSNEFPLLDSAKYFLDKIEIISQSDYIPSTEDILRSRKITTGIHQIKFTIKMPKGFGNGYQEFRMVDVGGQRDQRNKWIQVFEGIQAILFLISCSDFDQCLREDPKQNRLTESINLFRGVWNNRFLASAGIIVFLNKQDILEKKIRSGKNIGTYFPEYKQFENTKLLNEGINYFDECNRTKHFIKQKLVDITLEPPKRLSCISVNYIPRECYYHFTVATDTNSVKKVFDDVHNMIMKDNLASMELF